jgi:hypothetical protein
MRGTELKEYNRAKTEFLNSEEGKREVWTIFIKLWNEADTDRQSSRQEGKNEMLC